MHEVVRERVNGTTHHEQNTVIDTVYMLSQSHTTIGGNGNGNDNGEVDVSEIALRWNETLELKGR